MEGVRERDQTAEVLLFGRLTGTGSDQGTRANPAGNATAVVGDRAALALGALLGPERVSCGRIFMLLLDDDEVDAGL